MDWYSIDVWTPVLCSSHRATTPTTLVKPCLVLYRGGDHTGQAQSQETVFLRILVYLVIYDSG